MFRRLFYKMMFSNKVISQRNLCLICETTTKHSGSWVLNSPLHHAARILNDNKKYTWQAAKQQNKMLIYNEDHPSAQLGWLLLLLERTDWMVH